MKATTDYLSTKKLLRAFLFLFLSVSVITCRSTDDEIPPPRVYPEENPLAAYIVNAGFTTSTNIINAADYEFGLVFSPLVNGKIKALEVQIPDTNANLRVTIWDYETKTPVITEMVNVTAANTVIRKPISDLALTKDKKYLISMNSNDWYNREKPGSGATTYPITAGNIKFTEYLWKSGPAQTFPTGESNTYYAGDLSFVFQQTQ